MNATNARMLALRNRQSEIGKRLRRSGFVALAKADRKCSGFTLVEALVAIGLTTILLWGLLQLYSSATTFSSTVTTEAELCSAGRAVLERMTREISSATIRDSHLIAITGSGDFENFSFYAPIGDNGAEVVRVQYRANGSGTTRTLERNLGDGSNWASFGLNVERLKFGHIEADGTTGSGPKTFSNELPMAVNIEIRFSDRKKRATIALTSSAFLPGSGL